MSEKRILVVDDNKDFADFFSNVLSERGYKADSCYSGARAIEAMKDEPFNIVFVDMRMPDMDGIETLKEIKKIAPETTVIIMTGYSVDEMVHKAIEEKVSHVIYKPFEIEKVLSLIKDMV